MSHLGRCTTTTTTTRYVPWRSRLVAVAAAVAAEASLFQAFKKDGANLETE